MAKILIIDDDKDIIESMRVTLASKGHEAITAESGEEGLEKAKQERPDLIILDVMMPGIDGFKSSQILKKDPDMKKIPILMLTAIKDKMGLDFQKEAGDEDWLPVDAYCEKPLDHDHLIQQVEDLLKLAQD